MHRQLLTMVQRYAYCFYSIQTYENEHNFKYEYVIRMRPDHVFYGNVPQMASFMKNEHILIWDDQIAFSHRRDAITILAVPSLTYTRCYDINLWRRICPASISNHWNCSEQIPCEPMLSVSLYTKTKITIMDLRVRRASSQYSYDFCLKRHSVPHNLQRICSKCKDSDNICQSCPT